MKAKIAEIFESIQGEGIYQGTRQLFIRFYGCNLNCNFCDTKLSFYQEYSLEDLLKKIDEFKGKYHSISLTGGEPLLQIEFLNLSLPELKKRNSSIYLESNGTLPDELREIIDVVDIIAMDIKLPSSTGLKEYWQEHKEFLKIAVKKDIFVKTVICNSTKFIDLKKAVEILAGINKDIPFILQPNSFQISNALLKKIEELRIFCLNHLTQVKIIPQWHKFMGVK